MTFCRYNFVNTDQGYQSQNVLMSDADGVYMLVADHLAAMEAGPKWIHCGEQLPEPGVEVVGLDSYNQRRYIAKRSEHCHNWMVQDEGGFVAHGHITHWMPLPQPPQGRDERHANQPLNPQADGRLMRQIRFNIQKLLPCRWCATKHNCLYCIMAIYLFSGYIYDHSGD